MADTVYNKLPGILYSCYAESSRQGEQFIPEHVFGYAIAGTLEMYDNSAIQTFREGDFTLFTRNHLAKFNKYPPEEGVYKSISVVLDQETLRRFSVEYGHTAERSVKSAAAVQLKPSALLRHYVASLEPYMQETVLPASELVALKIREILLILLQEDPSLKNILFNFDEPGKIDLKAFMNTHFKFNVELKRFAYLTGRSLATFKRDFEKIFQMPPSRWLLQRRLQEAYFLITEKRKKPTDVYLEVGFEDLSHFSFSFKKEYGVAPSHLLA